MCQRSHLVMLKSLTGFSAEKLIYIKKYCSQKMDKTIKIRKEMKKMLSEV